MRLKSGRIWYVPGFGDERKGFEKWPALIRSIEARPVHAHPGAGPDRAAARLAARDRPALGRDLSLPDGPPRARIPAPGGPVPGHQPGPRPSPRRAGANTCAARSSAAIRSDLPPELLRRPAPAWIS